MKLKLFSLFVVAILVVLGSHIYYQMVLFPGVSLSIVLQSLLIKTTFRVPGPIPMSKLGAMIPPLVEGNETEKLKIQTFNITFDTRKSDLYLEEVGDPISQYSLIVYQPKQFKEGGYPIILY